MAGLDWHPRTLTDRQGEEVHVERATFAVPEIHGSDSARLDLVVHRVVGERPELPPLLFLCGGPGESAVAYLKHPPFRQSLRRCAGQRTLVLLEQRGCGESDPEFRIDALAVPDEALADPSLLCETSRRSILDQLLASGRHLRAYTVQQSASDVHRLIDLLGSPVRVLAHSYGTHLAQFVLKEDSRPIERTALLGFEGPNQTFKLPSQLKDQLYRLHRHTGANLFDWANGLPRTLSIDGRLVDRFVIRQMIAGWSSLSNRWGDLVGMTSDEAKLAQAWSKFRKGWHRSGAFFLNDHASGATQDRWDSVMNEDPVGWGDVLNFPFPLVGEGLPMLDDSERSPLVSDTPILILTGTMDGFTPTSNAREGLEFLSRARLHEIEGAAHNDLLTAPAGIELAAEFLSAS